MALLPRRGRIIQWFTLVVTLVTFGLTLHLPAHYLYGHPGFQFEVDIPWIANPAIRYHLGVDGISLWLVVLTGFLAPLGVLASWKTIAHRTKEFYFFFLLQQTAMFGVFVALDLFLYYAFWEMTLVPMAIMISMFGRDRGTEAAIKFFIYTFLPSALLLVAIVWLYAKTGTFDFVRLQSILAQGGLPPQALFWASLAFLVAFAVKVPMFPLHGWLGDVFSEAPTAIVMVAAGKLGLYSILRFNLGLFPAQARQVAPWMIALAVIGILYGGLIAIVQKDMKRLVAFSTVSAAQLLHSRHLLLCRLRRGRGRLPDGERGHLRRRAVSAPRLHVRTLWNLRDRRLRRPGQAPAQYGDLVRHHLARAGRPAPDEWVCGRVSYHQRQFPRACCLGLGGHRRRHPQRFVHAVDDPARLLR